jgi:hypothetical protein
MPNQAPQTAMRLLTAILPLALTPLFYWLLAEGHLNLGGGEKDILLTVPWLLWSLAFLFGAMWNWHKHLPLARALGWAALVATAMLLILGTVILFVGFRPRATS